MQTVITDYRLDVMEENGFAADKADYEELFTIEIPKTTDGDFRHCILGNEFARIPEILGVEIDENEDAKLFLRASLKNRDLSTLQVYALEVSEIADVYVMTENDRELFMKVASDAISGYFQEHPAKYPKVTLPSGKEKKLDSTSGVDIHYKYEVPPPMYSDELPEERYTDVFFYGAPNGSVIETVDDGLLGSRRLLTPEQAAKELQAQYSNKDHKATTFFEVHETGKTQLKLER